VCGGSCVGRAPRKKSVFFSLLRPLLPPSVCLFVCLSVWTRHLATWFAGQPLGLPLGPAESSRKQEQNGGRASVLWASNARSHNTAQANNAHSFLAFFCVLKTAQKEPLVALQTVCARPLVQLLRRHSAAGHKDHCL